MKLTRYGDFVYAANNGETPFCVAQNGEGKTSARIFWIRALSIKDITKEKGAVVRHPSLKDKQP